MARRILSGNDLGVVLADALGLKYVRNIKLTCNYDEVAVVDVEMFAHDDNGKLLVEDGELVRELKRYRLVEEEERDE